MAERDKGNEPGPSVAQGGPKRRDVLLGGGSLLTAALASSSASAAAHPPARRGRPNIVFMLVDNLGYGDLSCYTGGPIRGVSTPRIDKFASEGLRLTNFNVEPECTPSRSAFMTGRMPIRSGTASVVMTGGKDGLTPWEYTIAELLSDAGYTTAHYGKWHLGTEEGRLPTNQGFDEWFGIPRSSGETAWALQNDFDPEVYKGEPVMEGVKGQPSKVVRDYTYAYRPFIDREITNRSVAYIKKHAKAEKPFFLYIPFTLPHAPPLAHPDFVKKGRSQYQNVLEEIDHNVGAVLDALDAEGIRNDTIVVFASDNGPQTMWGVGVDYGGQADSGPFRGEFPSGWEGAIRTAGIVRWPGHTPAGKVSNEIVSLLDFYRSFAKVAGAEARVPSDRPMDSIEMSGFLFGGAEKSGREHIMIFYRDDLLAIKWRNFKFHYMSMDPARGADVVAGQGEITGTRTLYNYPLMFDLENDPKELWNIGALNAWGNRAAAKIMGEYRKSVAAFPNIPPGADGPAQPAAPG